MARLLYKFYTDSMRLRPWSTTIISTGILVGTGDVLAQQLVERAGLKKHDVRRTANMAFLGCTLVGPGLRTWYLILERVVRGTGTIAVVKKVFLDQVLWAPIFVGVFLSSVSLLNGKSTEETVTGVKSKYIDVMKTNYLIWPIVQMTNFYFIPFQHRVLFVNFVSLFWNTYLAWASNKTAPVKEITM